MEQHRLKLESNITQALLIGLSAGNAAYIVRDVAVSDYSILTWGSVLLVAVSMAGIYLIRVHQLFEVLYFPLLLLIHGLHIGIFFYLDGFNSTLALDFLNIGFVIMFAGSGRKRYMLAWVFVLSVFGLLVYQTFAVSIADYYNDNIVLDMSLHIGISLYLAYVIKKEYSAFQHELEKSNKELNLTNEELQSANEEITLLNEQLEEELQRKSNESHERRLRLIHYASKNAHEVRAPPVRIMGVMEILRMELPRDPEEMQRLIQIIDQNAKEMDNILRQVSRVLDEGE